MRRISSYTSFYTRKIRYLHFCFFSQLIYILQHNNFYIENTIIDAPYYTKALNLYAYYGNVKI